MSHVKRSGHKSRASASTVMSAIIVFLLILLIALSIGLKRYYNMQELEMLVDGATARGQSYSVVINNWLTGSYSFSAE